MNRKTFYDSELFFYSLKAFFIGFSVTHRNTLLIRTNRSSSDKAFKPYRHNLLRMQWNDERIILANPDILSESHLPPEIHSRQSQLKETALCFRPLTESRKPVNCWFYGRPGVGKTATARWTLRKLDTEAGITGVYVNCWEYPTFFSVLERIALELKDRAYQLVDKEKISPLPALEGEAKGLVDDALSALLNLGYSQKAAKAAIEKTRSQAREMTLEGIIREALKILA